MLASVWMMAQSTYSGRITSPMGSSAFLSVAQTAFLKLIAVLVVLSVLGYCYLSALG